MANNVTIFHGSQYIIKQPAYGLGNPHNDYGLGFYCTQEIALAKEWACTEEESGYANQYELDMDGLSVMYLSSPDYNILNWLAILLDNRIFRISNDVALEGKEYILEYFLPGTERYDIIIGYRANDSYFSFARAFLNNTISLDKLERAMYLGRLGEQTVLKSEKSFRHLRYILSEPAEREIYYLSRIARDKEARSAYEKERVRQKAADSIYLFDILRERWGKDDPRIRRNIPG